MEILTSTAGTIVGEIAKYTLFPLGRQIGYLIFYNGNINNLIKVFNKLRDKKTAVDLQVDAAERNLRIPPPEMKRWQHNVNDVDGLTKKFLEEEIIRNVKCLNDLCPNPKSRYSLSRKAAKMKHEILVLLCQAEKFKQIDLPAPLPTLGSTVNTEDTLEFESRNLIMNEILEALRDDTLSIMSICGQGGVGKTTMVEKLGKIVERQNLFDEVAMAVVSQNPDVKTIQGDIASCFGLRFHEENEQERAQKLHERIIVKCEKRILLILDDVWTEMDFRRLRIPSAGKRVGYKILLTSRREDECQKMGSLMNFRVNALSNEEGWNLFKGTAFSGYSIVNQDNLAKQIAYECDGLPIAIVTIAKALKGRDIRIWADALNQLRSSNRKCISGMEKVYSRLELSYNLLQREEAKACFLLCCLFPEDYAVKIEDLVRYAVGLQLLLNVETILQARNKVYVLIGELKESFLLLDGNKDKDGYIKMHDVVREVAMSIAAREKSYLISCDKMMNHWPNNWLDRYSDCTAISLGCKKIEERPTDLECPKLQLLRLRSSGSLPDNFFDGMKELKVIALEGCFPPKSVNGIKEARALHLSHVPSTTTFEDLKNVEILKVKILQELPYGVGLMENLRLLDMRECYGLEYIPAGVLTKLSKLEELYVSLYFKNWITREDGERMNASLTELESQHITTLEFGVSDIRYLPKRSILELLVNFQIFVGSSNHPTTEEARNALILTGDASEIISSGICVLLKRAEYLKLEKVENLKNDLYGLGDVCYPKLKTLKMHTCYEIEKLADVNKIKVECFRMLKNISVSSCEKLEYMFPTIMAARLSRSLQSVYLSRCQNMEGIFKGNEEGDDVEFPNLKDIYLSDLPKLKALWIHKSNDHQEVESNSIEPPNSILFPSSWIVPSNLKVLELTSCHSLKVVFSPSVAEKLLHLQSLLIRDCEKVEYIVGGHKGNTSKTLIFPMLTDVSFRWLPELMSFCVDNHIFLDWRSPEKMYVNHCPKIKTIIGAVQSPSIFDQKQILFKIPSEFKELLKEGEIEEVNRITETIQFSRLKSITLANMENMRCFYGGIHATEFPLLEVLRIASCTSMTTFSYGSSLCTPKLDRLWIGDTEVSPIIDLNKTVREKMLVNLHLYCLDDIERITLDHLSSEEMSEIRQINIEECKNLLNVIPCNLISRLQTVEILDVKKCDLVEEIFEYDTGVNTEKENGAVSYHLEQLILENLYNLKHVFDKIPTTAIDFQKLKMLSIHNCISLKNVFSVSTMRGLFQLEQLRVCYCRNLEEIVAKENNEEKAVTDKIVLPHLWSVDVSGVPNLKYFYSGTCALDFPSLKNLTLNEGHIMKSFSNGLVSTPQLTEVEIYRKHYQHSGDLNEDVKNEKFETVYIQCAKDFMKPCLVTEDSNRIQYLSILSCHTLSNAIPYNLIGKVQKLKSLTVERCDLVEEIFECGVNTEDTSVAVISNLEEITLKFLHKLKHIFNKIPRSILSFPKLRKLDVDSCKSLKNIFSISAITDLIQLEELKITNCDGVEQIVAKEEEEEITNKIVFPQLRLIDISYFNESSFKLQCFYSGMCALEFPLLENLSLERCYSMRTFSTGSVSAPMLQRLHK